MKEKEESFKLIFTNKIEDISGTLNTCISYIQTNADFPGESLILQKIKWVLTELLTNAVKHSGTSSTILTIKVLEEEIIFIKEDIGNPVSLYLPEEGKHLTYPFNHHISSKKVLIYGNQTDALMAHIQPDNSIIFINSEVELPESEELLSDISEHFGLMIIAKCTDHFTYTFTESDRTNRFICRFSLK